jgi:molybdopterin synthase sulfur carrier subunit
MAVAVKIPPALRPATGGESEVSVDGTTVAEVLEALFGRFGELRGRIADEQGSLRRFVNIYVGGEDIRFLEGLHTPVADGSELTILPAVAGGV